MTLEEYLEAECELARTRVASLHRQLMATQWGTSPPPEFFDHHIDLFYNWLETRNPLWLERGVFSGLALKGGDVLELAYGDGFNARNFYSLRSNKVVACDYNVKAIETARRKNSADNIEYVVADIHNAMPEGTYDNIILDGALEHFSPSEIEKLLKDIKGRLAVDGIFSGYTIVERASRIKSLEHHKREFHSKEDLLDTLAPYFKNVTVFETVYPSRHNLYWWASDGELPFGAGWANMICKRGNDGDTVVHSV